MEDMVEKTERERTQKWVSVGKRKKIDSRSSYWGPIRLIEGANFYEWSYSAAAQPSCWEGRSLLTALPLSTGRGGEILTGGDCLLLGLPFISHLQMWCMYCFPCKVNPFLQIMTVWKFSGIGCGTGERGMCIVSSQHQWCFVGYYKGLHIPKDSSLDPLKL